MQTHDAFAGGERVSTDHGDTTYEIIWDHDHPWFTVMVSGLRYGAFAVLVDFVGSNESHVLEAKRRTPLITLSKVVALPTSGGKPLAFDAYITVTRRSTLGRAEGEPPIVAPPEVIMRLAEILDIEKWVKARLKREAEAVRGLV